jgi:glycosyltransferase
MKISIITVSYNSSKTIKDTFDSVLNQTYNNIEYIVIDGNSKDNTVEIIKSYEIKFKEKGIEFKWISEKDDGLYDAMNKGIKIATGKYIGILNSDDFYCDNFIIEKVVKTLEKNKTDSLYANLYYVDAKDTNKIIRNWKSQRFKDNLFKNGWHPAHPTFFVKKEIYEKYGIFNLNYKIAADYEIMLRFLEKYKISTQFLDEYLVKMRLGGESNQSIKNIIKANNECYNAWKDNGLKISKLFIIKKLFRKILQYR